MRTSLLLSVLVLALAGCAKSHSIQNVAPNIDLSPGIRLAVLPFGQAPDVSDDEVSPSGLVRQGLVASFRLKTHLEVLENAYVDDVCARKGWTPETLKNVPPTEAGLALGADLVLSGAVMEWSRRYYGVQSSANVGASVRLHDARTGMLLWEADRLETKQAGLTGGPTGYTSVALSPLQGLAKSNLFLLANELSSNLVDMLLTPTLAETKDAEAKLPKLAVESAAFSATATGTLALGDVITVVALATPGQIATFDLGTSRRRIPMTETTPGHYVGKYVVEQGDALRDAAVVLSLSSRRGYRIRHRVGDAAMSVGAGR